MVRNVKYFIKDEQYISLDEGRISSYRLIFSLLFVVSDIAGLKAENLFIAFSGVC